MLSFAVVVGMEITLPGTGGVWTPRSHRKRETRRGPRTPDVTQEKAQCHPGCHSAKKPERTATRGHIPRTDSAGARGTGRGAPEGENRQRRHCRELDWAGRRNAGSIRKDCKFSAARIKRRVREPLYPKRLGRGDQVQNGHVFTSQGQ